MPPSASNPRETPAMRQYYRFKKLHPGCVLLFRIGDFYEMFDDDAVAVSRALGLTLTQRTEGVPMAGMPFHQLEVYVKRLIDQGFRVAVAEQMQDPKEAKGVIERSVTRVLTPGTLVDDTLLSDDRTSTIACACFLDAGDAPSGRVALAVAELSTGDFVVLECTAESLVDELARRSVSELLYADTADGNRPARVARVIDTLRIAGTPQASWYFRPDEAREALCELFGVTTLAGFGLAEDDSVIAPAGALVRYFRQTQTPDLMDKESKAPRARAPKLTHLRPPRRESPAGLCMIDATTLRSLEVLRTIRNERSRAPGTIDPGSTGDGSLTGVFSGPGGPCTPMGKRLLREWLCRPSSDLGTIRARHRAVATLKEDRRTAGELAKAINKVQDVSRIAGRIALGRCTPRDLVGLGVSLMQAGPIVDALRDTPALAAPVAEIESARAALEPLAGEIARLCVDAPPTHLREGGLIRDGVDAELDEARLLQRDAGVWLADYQKSLMAEHQLPGMKVGYNKVFGYYIELTKAQAKGAPPSFSRKQTLTGAERYVTPELKEFEEKVTRAESRALEREQELFARLCEACGAKVHEAARFADAVARMDVLLCFASIAQRRRWVEPEMREEPALRIEQGRHPVLDELLGSGFVPNDVELGGSDGATERRSDEGGETPGGGGPAPSLALITGPNMAGKSTFIRQTALVVLLAHAGSFVPADHAVIGVTDRIFTRIGADDALHAGQSTFMVEMTETARILHHATDRSLIVLDEIGRGTSTLDGLSLAWAIAERLALGDAGCRGPRTLFATHYHELTELEDRHPTCIRNLHVAVREWGDQIVFLHRILPGRTDQSYGIHVAKLAGIPDPTIKRAREILESLAVQHHVDGGSRPTPALPAPPPPSTREGQMFLFTEYMPHPAIAELKQLRLDALSPMQAFDELRRLKGMIEKPG